MMMAPTNSEIIDFAKSVASKAKPTLSSSQRELLALIAEKSTHPHKNLEKLVSDVTGDELCKLISEYKAMPSRQQLGRIAEPGESVDGSIAKASSPLERLAESVVTTDGRAGSPLLRVFHGTNSDFVDFRVGRASRGQATDTQGAIFFTSSPKAAEYHTTVNRGIIRGENANGANIRPAYLDIKNPFVINAVGGHKDPTKVRAWISDAKKHGNDGVIIKNVIDAEIGAAADVYIVFNNSQITSEIAHRAAQCQVVSSGNSSRPRTRP